MHLTTLWFAIITFLWVGYFVLEGFDFGVGILLPLLGRDEPGRRVLLATIGPVWDGNEVWVVVAAGATFAAFPDWYATLFSGFYLPMLLVLVALIFRNVALEYRGKRDEARWRARWDAAIVAGSAAPAILWGVMFGSLAHGIPLNAAGDFTGTILDLTTPYALLAGLTTLTLFVTHGAVFLALKTHGTIRAAARRTALRVGVVAVLATGAFLTLTQLARGDAASIALAGVGFAALLAGLAATAAGRDGWAFAGTAAAIGLSITSLLVAVFPDVMPATLAAHSLTVTNAAASPYTLRLMSWVALGTTPLVLAYQAWTYWVFRTRLGRTDPKPAA